MTSQRLALDLTIALPVLDECATLEPVVHGALAALDELAEGAGKLGEVLIIDDGSTDGSGALADELARKHERVRVVHHPEPTGYAQVQRACFRDSRGTWTLLLPADGQVDASVLATLWKHAGAAELVVGVPDDPSAPRRLGSRLYHLLGAALFGRRPWWGLGPCLLVRRSVVADLALRATTPVLMTELAVRIEATGGTVHAEPVTVRPRSAGQSARRSLYPRIGRIFRELIELRFAAAEAVPQGSGERIP